MMSKLVRMYIGMYSKIAWEIGNLVQNCLDLGHGK